MNMMTVNTLLRSAVILCFGMNAAHAQHSVSLSTEVDRIENPLLTHANPGGVTLVRVTPTYVFQSLGDQYRSRFSAGAVLERSSNTALVASRDYPNMGYTWVYTWPTATVELRASLAESATRNSEFRDLGRVTIDTRERSVVAGATYEQELAARTRLILNAANTNVTYDTPLLEDYREQTASSRIAWEASETTVYFFEPSYVRLTPTEGGAVESQSRWLVGIRATLAPDLSITAHAGQVRAVGSQDGPGSLGRLQLTYTGSRLSPGIEWSKDVAASGLAASYVGTETQALRLGYRISEGATLLASMTRSKSDGIAGGRGSVFSLRLENELNSRWTSTLAYEDRKSIDSAGSTGKGWAIRAGLSYAYPSR